MNRLLAQATDVFGNVKNTILPAPYQDGINGGLILFLSNVLRLVFVGAGMFAFLNFIIAGFQFMTAGGDSKAVTKAWDRIWQSLTGLVIVVGSFALAALFGYLIFGDAGFILNPKIYGP